MQQASSDAGTATTQTTHRGYEPSTQRRQEVIDRPGEMLRGLLGPDAGETAVDTVFQPVVDLATEQVVAYEALTRGPEGTPLHGPRALFDRFRAHGAEGAFDRACRDAALARAAQGGLAPPLTVFVNIEPGLLLHGPQGAADGTWSQAPHDLRCVIELTERALASQPARLLQAIAMVRDLNWGVALDDVGSDPTSLALMSLLRPDVIKLDLRLVQERPDPQIAAIIAAVSAQVEETGALVVAEGIESEAHLQTAVAMGATLGQGYHFGHPLPLPETLPPCGRPVPFMGGQLAPDGPTPYQLVIAEQATRRDPTPFVAAMHERLLALAANLGPATVVLTAGGPSGVLDDLEGQVAFAAALDDRGEPATERDTVVMSPHFAAAVLSRGAGGGEDPDSHDSAVTHDRRLVARCARALMARLNPVD